MNYDKKPSLENEYEKYLPDCTLRVQPNLFFLYISFYSVLNYVNVSTSITSILSKFVFLDKSFSLQRAVQITIFYLNN